MARSRAESAGPLGCLRGICGSCLSDDPTLGPRPWLPHHLDRMKPWPIHRSSSWTSPRAGAGCYGAVGHHQSKASCPGAGRAEGEGAAVAEDGVVRAAHPAAPPARLDPRRDAITAYDAITADEDFVTVQLP